MTKKKYSIAIGPDLLGQTLQLDLHANPSPLATNANCNLISLWKAVLAVQNTPPLSTKLCSKFWTYFPFLKTFHKLLSSKINFLP